MPPAPATSPSPPPLPRFGGAAGASGGNMQLCDSVDDDVVGSTPTSGGGRGGGGGGGMGSRDWSLIPYDLLDLIASKSSDVEDYVCFRAVCKPWRSATNPTNPKLPPSLPWLLLTYNPDDPFRRFYSLSRRKFYTFHLPETLHRVLWGTSHGCLLMADRFFSLSLLNPLTRSLIHLPAITSFPKAVRYQFLRIGNDLLCQNDEGRHLAISLPFIPEYFHCDVFTSGDNECFVVVSVLNSPHLLYCKVGATATAWTMLHAPPPKGYVQSIAYHNHRFYAVYDNSNVVFWDVGSTESEGKFFQPPTSMVQFSQTIMAGMVAFQGELMMVVSSYKRAPHQAKCDEEVLTAEFDVYKLTGDGWSNLEDIGDSSVFIAYERENMIMMGVGGDSAAGWRMNSIYFADVYKAEWFETFPLHQIHRSSMQEKLVTLSAFGEGSFDVFPPMWIMPSLLSLGDYATPI